MSAGQKEQGRRILLFLRALLRSRGGFTLIEFLVSAFLLAIVMAALFAALSTGEFGYTVSAAKTDLEFEVRRCMDYIIQDVRQTSTPSINNSVPLPSEAYIKFKKVTGINNSDGSYAYSDNFIEYQYDAALGELTRNELNAAGSVLRSWKFYNIITSPFYRDAGVPLTGAGVHENKLIVVISAQKQVRGQMFLSFSLTEEVKIRNE